MIAINARYDGKVIVPDAPLELPANQRVRIQVEPIEPDVSADATPKLALGLQPNSILYIAPGFDEPLGDDFWLGGDK